MAAPLADPGQRLLARIVDTLIVGLPIIILVRELVSGHTVDVVAPPAVAGCMLLYESIQLAVWGRTLGKRFAGIEVVQAIPAGQRAEGTAVEDAESPRTPATTVAESGAPSGEARTDETAAEAGEKTVVPVDEQARLGILRAVLRAAVYSLPIVARPIPVLGLLAGIFWVANAGLLYEGTHRQALHDRLAGTFVVKRPSSDSSAL